MENDLDESQNVANPTPVVSPEMQTTPTLRNKRKIFLIVLILVFILVGFGILAIVLGLVAVRYMEKAPASSPEISKVVPVLTPLPSLSTADWSTYTNKEYNYSIKYPFPYMVSEYKYGPEKEFFAAIFSEHSPTITPETVETVFTVGTTVDSRSIDEVIYDPTVSYEYMGKKKIGNYEYSVVRNKGQFNQLMYVMKHNDTLLWMDFQEPYENIEVLEGFASTLKFNK